MNNLHLNVKKIYFNERRSGNKFEEYRLYNDFWIKRLVERNYFEIHYKAGYPKKGDKNNIDIMPYRGYTIKTITHPHFGPKPVKVFAIKLSVEIRST